MLENIRIVLINTSHPGNIGAAARAMKTMGLSELYLVAPRYFPDPRATEMASSATDIVDRAMVVTDLDQALAGCHLVIGTSARSRSLSWPMLAPREMAEKALQESKKNRVAIIFGREQSGLTNEELHRCHFHVQIPANPEYSSLNLASAVQVLAYELRVASLLVENIAELRENELADALQMENFYAHLERVLIEIDFIDPEEPRQLMTRLRRLFYRARPDVVEMNILRGVLGMVEKRFR